jgi:hypothetical protein
MDTTNTTSAPPAGNSTPSRPRPAALRRRKAESVSAEREVKVARISADQETVDRLRWCEAVALYLGIKTASAVILRRALTSYVNELERMLKRVDDGSERAEAVRLRKAAKGETQKLPDAALDAHPPRPFSEIKSEARAKAAEAAKSRPLQPFTPTKGYRG